MGRYDWNPYTCELIYRMNTPIHEIFTARIVYEISLWIDSLASRTNANIDPRISTIASSIICRASSRIILYGDRYDKDEKHTKRSPDASFIHIDADFPGVVIKTSFSQKRKDLSRLAEDYIFGSFANIAAVVGLDIEYRGSKKASVSVWRPVEYLDSNGQPILRLNHVEEVRL
jgi:hypothetical protein